MTANSEESTDSFTAREFREALSGFATGVTIVTTNDEDGEPIGMTASSFNSVSMDPPLILWSVTKTAHSAPAFQACKHFAVHVLASDQVAMSNTFAKSGADKFTDTGYTMDANNVPILPGTVCRFDCSTWSIYEGGDHWIMVGKVENLERGNNDPLVFSGGSYATASPLRPPNVDVATNAGEHSAIDGLLIYNLSRAYHQISHQFHQAVRDSGLTLSEWRILASLYGGAKRTYGDLAARTFVDPKALRDMVASMEEAGLCTIDQDARPNTIVGNKEGDSRVEHLFALGAEQEQAAIGKDPNTSLETLIVALKSIIANTDNLNV